MVYSKKTPSRICHVFTDWLPSIYSCMYVSNRFKQHLNLSMSFTILQFLARKNVHVILQLLVSPKLSTLDFWLILKLNQTMKGKTSDSPETIRSNQQIVWRGLQRMGFRCVSAGSAKVGHCIESEGKSWKAINPINAHCSTQCIYSISHRTLVNRNYYRQSTIRKVDALQGGWPEPSPLLLVLQNT